VVRRTKDRRANPASLRIGLEGHWPTGEKAAFSRPPSSVIGHALSHVAAFLDIVAMAVAECAQIVGVLPGIRVDGRAGGSRAELFAARHRRGVADRGSCARGGVRRTDARLRLADLALDNGALRPRLSHEPHRRTQSALRHGP
jgi:hypothetical protein